MTGQQPSRKGRMVQWLYLGGAVLAFSLGWWFVRSPVGAGVAGIFGSAGGTGPKPGAAVEALGRIGTREAQSELLALLAGLPEEDEARRVIVPLLRPSGLDDEFAARLAAHLDGPVLTATEKKQLAFTLALIGLRDGMK